MGSATAKKLAREGAVVALPARASRDWMPWRQKSQARQQDFLK
ncbi:MAG: hypothetical protein LLF99_15615 [Desulfobacteraceae bacterium]|nr:hypothetical protein [Desulfobacteraceae bacterium]